LPQDIYFVFLLDTIHTYSMLIQRLSVGFRRALPEFIYLFLRRSYFSFLFLLGPNIAIWRHWRAIRNPVTYREKVRRKMAKDRDPILTTLCDKIKVRELVTDVVGEKYLTKAFYIGHDANEIDWASLPREYVCKVNHGAGGIIVVRERAGVSAKLPTNLARLGWVHLEVHPDNVKPAEMKALLEHWLHLDYWWKKSMILPEWGYKNIERGVIIEELLKVDDDIPNDYKFYVVNGKVKLIREQTKRYTNSRGLYEYDRDWNLYGSTLWDRTWKRLPGLPPEIPNLKEQSPMLAAELVRVAEVVGSATDAMRVDLYAVGDRVVFGETTIYPYAGNDFFTQEWLAVELGKDWRQNY
jgi:hypothetical protein